MNCRHNSTHALAADGTWHGPGAAPAEGEVWCYECESYVPDPFTPDPALECLNHGPLCSGTVEYRYPLSGTGRAFPRCDFHWAKRLEDQEAINRRYPTTAPSDFDPAYAGESWDED